MVLVFPQIGPCHQHVKNKETKKKNGFSTACIEDNWHLATGLAAALSSIEVTASKSQR